MRDLRELQSEHRFWVQHNFPGQKPHEPLLGLVEEVGELAHAHLKHEQQIRGLDDIALVQEKKKDAIGDIVIFLASYCNANGFDLAECVEETWAQVRNRDWQAAQFDGGEA